MTGKDWVKIVASKTGVPQKDVEIILNEAHEIIRQALQKNDIVKISSFGTF